MPWQKVHKVSLAIQTVNIAFDPDAPAANAGGTVLEAVTKDQLNINLTGQLRYRVSEQNLYAYLFGVKRPISHVVAQMDRECASSAARYGIALDASLITGPSARGK